MLTEYRIGSWNLQCFRILMKSIYIITISCILYDGMMGLSKLIMRADVDSYRKLATLTLREGHNHFRFYYFKLHYPERLSSKILDNGTTLAKLI